MSLQRIERASQQTSSNSTIGTVCVSKRGRGCCGASSEAGKRKIDK
jgi:hypothetical protein